LSRDPANSKAVLDSSRILANAYELSFPRYPGTEGDRAAIELVAAKLDDSGLAVQREEFTYDIGPAFLALRVLMLSAALLLLAAGLLAGRSLVAAAFCLGTALVAGGVFLAWAPWLERIYRAPGPTRTSNVFAVREAARPRATLIFLAHHDSKSQNLTLPFRAFFTLGAIGSSLVLAALLVLAAVGVSPTAGAWPVALGVAAAISLAVLSTIHNGNRSPGGVDNAGSVGILLELARRLPEQIVPEVELIFLSPGAEEDHMVGAMRWLDAHAEQLADRPVFAINIDGAGIPGRVVLLERYGLGGLFSPELSRVAREAAEELGIEPRGVYLPPAMGVDAIPFVNRGIPCLTLSSGSLGRASLSVHSAGDVAENLDERALAEVAALAAEMAARLAERAGSSPAPTPRGPGQGM
jgi:acetylornithine deacetylase/succinyl-diaminopimelate desuccinylase-like protein